MHNLGQKAVDLALQQYLRRRAEDSVRNLVLLHTAKDLHTSNRPLRDRLAAQHYQFSSTVSRLAIAAALR